MQTVQRYLINQLVIAYISGYHGRNSKVYDRRLTLHRGVSNPISFTFKNEDQKAQDITAKTYELNVIDTESKKSVITKTLTMKKMSFCCNALQLVLKQLKNIKML